MGGRREGVFSSFAHSSSPPPLNPQGTRPPSVLRDYIRNLQAEGATLNPPRVFRSGGRTRGGGGGGGVGGGGGGGSSTAPAQPRPARPVRAADRRRRRRMYEDTTSEEEEEVESETSVSSDGDDATTTTTSDDESEDDATSASEDEAPRQKDNGHAGRAAALPPIAFAEAGLPSPPRRRSLLAPPPQTQTQPPQPRLPRVRVPAPSPASPRGVDDALLVSGAGPCGDGAGGLLGLPGPVALALTPRGAPGPSSAAAPTSLRSPRGPTFMTSPPKKRPGPRTRAAAAVAAATRPATPAGVPRPPAPGGDDVAAILDAGVCVATTADLFDHVEEDGGLAPTCAPPPSPTASARAPVAAWPPSSAPWAPPPAPRLDLDAVIARVTQTVTASPSLRARVVGPECSGGCVRAAAGHAAPPSSPPSLAAAAARLTSTAAECGWLDTGRSARVPLPPWGLFSGVPPPRPPPVATKRVPPEEAEAAAFVDACTRE